MTFDPAQALAGLGALLLLIGVLPLTHVVVGILLLLALTRLTFTA